jgi:glycosyltransferase involved in cell wall biosynthesis
VNKLSVAIITKDEEKNIPTALNSVKWADEIVVVDSGSSDKTVEICKQFGANVIDSEWLGFGKTKQKAVDHCRNRWVLVLDADEVITESLKDSIIKILSEPKFSGYRIKRNSFYLGKEIKYCGWDKDYTLRLFDREVGRFNEKIVHESVVMEEGLIGKITSPMLHYTFPTISSHIEKMISYSKLGAEQLKNRGKSCNLLTPFLRGGFKFIKMYLLKKGFMDGRNGFLLSVNSSYGVYLKYLYLWEKR